MCFLVPCNVSNCEACTEENMCRDCAEGFEPNTSGSTCVTILAESSAGASLTPVVVIGKRDMVVKATGRGSIFASA